MLEPAIVDVGFCLRLHGLEPVVLGRGAGLRIDWRGVGLGQVRPVHGLGLWRLGHNLRRVRRVGLDGIDRLARRLGLDGSLQPLSLGAAAFAFGAIILAFLCGALVRWA